MRADLGRPSDDLLPWRRPNHSGRTRDQALSVAMPRLLTMPKANGSSGNLRRWDYRHIRNIARAVRWGRLTASLKSRRERNWSERKVFRRPIRHTSGKVSLGSGLRSLANISD